MKIKPSLHGKIIRRLREAQKDGFELLHDAPPVIGTQEKYSDGKGKYRTANGLMHDIFNYSNKRVYGFALQKGYFVRAPETYEPTIRAMNRGLGDLRKYFPDMKIIRYSSSYGGLYCKIGLLKLKNPRNSKLELNISVGKDFFKANSKAGLNEIYRIWLLPFTEQEPNFSSFRSDLDDRDLYLSDNSSKSETFLKDWATHLRPREPWQEHEKEWGTLEVYEYDGP